MFVLGVTGSIGCGKSTVTRLLGDLGALTLDADHMAKAALQPGSPALHQVTARFGADLLHADGTLNRTLLAQRVFADPERLRQLEALIHPRVFASMASTLADWVTRLPSPTGAVAALEIPLLYETHAESLCDAVLVVACGTLQEQRLASRPGLDLHTRQQIIAQQLPEEKKCQLADWIIDNRCPPEQLPARVARIWQEIQHRPTAQQHAWPDRWRRFLSDADHFSTSCGFSG
ncbi:MAG: dephospho-CoA kinase [Magnetococcales bacterium]|nr:dephospho-CoA kinase [Magnetococcales bacterium]NGZ04982.1 dephospho-CoA kinase [Magnetococcales bacterium]